MRSAALSLSALMLAACGGGDVKVSSVAPDGSSETIQQLFTICSEALNEGAVIDALTTAAGLGWELEADSSQPSMPVDIMRNTALNHPDKELILQFYEHDGPHEKAIGCQLHSFGGDQLTLNLSLFDDFDGMEGRWQSVSEGKSGRWSKRSGNSVFSLHAIVSADTFTMIALNKITLK